ncbi:hypothetical protein H6P81_020613 [Aristolochia fimbriata]|uniref:Uncharacterized protein n=1 Tax=Aristolochia fimbriata TaxID=158543 RepID=A0AAV7DZ64_ARIFI|nr:hypothetical protein H6P81_020613 [Aristolochia fimbriata]
MKSKTEQGTEKARKSLDARTIIIKDKMLHSQIAITRNMRIISKQLLANYSFSTYPTTDSLRDTAFITHHGHKLEKKSEARESLKVRNNNKRGQLLRSNGPDYLNRKGSHNLGPTPGGYDSYSLRDNQVRIPCPEQTRAAAMSESNGRRRIHGARVWSPLTAPLLPWFPGSEPKT